MKILMVSIPSLHFFRWTEQLRNSGHEVYWFDISGRSESVERINWVSQKVNWKLKFNYKGRIFLKKNFPKANQFLQKYNEYDTATVFEKYLNEIKPDVVHSFALYLSCTPILEVMQKHINQKWIYSSWGSDLFYFQNKIEYLKDIKKVLPRIDFLFTDCKRDFEIAKQFGFKGYFLGIFPGGGGFDLEEMERYKIPLLERKTILVKGFQGRSGKAINVLKAIQKLEIELINFEIVIFGSDIEVVDYFNGSILKRWKNVNVVGKVSYTEVLKLMGKALIYIGNSDSDGIPNTLLEAICSGAFPIQSNPGGVTAEIIKNGENGFLIEDYENIDEIKNIIKQALFDRESISVFDSNLQIVEQLDYSNIRERVLNQYKQVFIK